MSTPLNPAVSYQPSSNAPRKDKGETFFYSVRETGGTDLSPQTAPFAVARKHFPGARDKRRLTVKEDWHELANYMVEKGFSVTIVQTIGFYA